jgi:predicted GNAT superfamily acetyltransferase
MSEDSHFRATSDRARTPASPAENGARLRAVESLGEYAACVVLQRETWGDTSSDIVPASLMQVATRAGGLTLGAFADDDTLIGFVFSLAGQRDGAPIHWSHMLAVEKDARGAGIGRRLKELQRTELARRGIRRILWTFDPLQARNAHLNLNRLGASVVEYVENMYGASRSRLHHGLATDRLVVSCATEGPLPPPARDGPSDRPVLTPSPRAGDVRHLLLDDRHVAPQELLVEIPSDLDETANRSAGAAADWRAATRTHLQWALAHGYAVTGLRRDPVATRAFYIIAKVPREARAI